MQSKMCMCVFETGSPCGRSGGWGWGGGAGWGVGGGGRVARWGGRGGRGSFCSAGNWGASELFFSLCRCIRKWTCLAGPFGSSATSLPASSQFLRLLLLKVCHSVCVFLKASRVVLWCTASEISCRVFLFRILPSVRPKPQRVLPVLVTDGMIAAFSASVGIADIEDECIAVLDALVDKLFSGELAKHAKSEGHKAVNRLAEGNPTGGLQVGCYQPLVRPCGSPHFLFLSLVAPVRMFRGFANVPPAAALCVVAITFSAQSSSRSRMWSCM